MEQRHVDRLDRVVHVRHGRRFGDKYVCTSSTCESGRRQKNGTHFVTRVFYKLDPQMRQKAGACVSLRCMFARMNLSDALAGMCWYTTNSRGGQTDVGVNRLCNRSKAGSVVLSVQKRCIFFLSRFSGKACVVVLVLDGM